MPNWQEGMTHSEARELTEPGPVRLSSCSSSDHFAARACHGQAGWRTTQDTTIELPLSTSATITLRVSLVPPEHGHTTLTLTPIHIMNMITMIMSMKGYSHSLQVTIALTPPAIPTTTTLLHHPRPAPRHPQRHNHQQLVRRPPTSDSHRRPPKRSPSLRASSSYWTSTAPSSSAPRALPSPPAANAINTPRPAASCPARISPSSARISSRRRRALG